MSTRRSLAVFAVIVAVLLSVTDVTAGIVRGRSRQKTSSGELRGLGKLELGGGWRHHPENLRSSVYSDDHLASAATDGALGRVGLAYWTDDNVALTVGYTIHDVETYSRTDVYGYDYDHTTIVHSVLFGLRYYLPRSRPYSTVLPYISAEAGPFIDTAAWSEYDDCDCEESLDSRSKAVASARLGGGVDLWAGPRFMIGLNGGYNFVEEFDEPIGGRYDYSGSDFGITFSFLFGRRGR